MSKYKNEGKDIAEVYDILKQRNSILCNNICEVLFLCYREEANAGYPHYKTLWGKSYMVDRNIINFLPFINKMENKNV